MNKNLFQLIFSTRLGMFVPAAECVQSRAGKSSSSTARGRRRALAAILALATLDNVSAAALDGLVTGGGGWDGADALQKSGAIATIQQTASKAILNWQQLNLRQGETLNFLQANSSWAALNRIHDANPSTIAGNVNAIGHIYFINSNGIIFGNGAQINVGSLTALTANPLDVTDAMFNNGILSDLSKAVFSGMGGFVTVEQGAALTAATGGRVMLLAKDVTNSGVITTPDGQTILAAGEKVYLAESDNPAGLLVEVDAGGTAKNLGEIVAQRGNVTLVGLAVNQEGVISASTSVRANGSIYLKARDTVTRAGLATDDPATTMSAKRGGVVTIGKGSMTTIAVETGDKEEALDEAMFKDNVLIRPSKVEISGRVIDIEGSIVAHGGTVTATAAFNPSLTTDVTTVGGTVNATRVYVGEDALIDVSGIDASAPMSRNQLEIQLYSEQLKDAPIQRGGPLFGEVIYVDASKGTAFTDIAPYLALKGKTIAENYARGGTVNLTASTGDVVLHAGSKVDVSGGSVTYEAGYIQESTLSYLGKTVAISQADPNIPYEKIADTYSITDPKWGVTRTWTMGPAVQATLGAQGTYKAAYSEGRNAGTVNVTATNALLQGELKATTKPGYTQRSSLPTGGTFNFTLNNGTTGAVPTFRLVTDSPNTLEDTFSVVGGYDSATGTYAQGDALPSADILLDNELFSNGFSDFTLTTPGSIVVDAAIHAAPKGVISLTTTGQAIVNADIVSPGGTITIVGSNTLADHVTLSTSGLYTNDMPGVSGAAQAAVVTDGGTINVTLGTLGDGVTIKADAGAWLKSTGKLVGGKGGKVVLNSVTSLGNANISAFGFSKGGTLNLSTFSNLQAGGQNPATSGTLWLPEAFFGTGGFADYTLQTSTSGSNILIGDTAGSATEIHPRAQLLVTKGAYNTLASGTDMANVASPVLQAEGQRAPSSVTFNSTFDSLKVAEHAVVRTDAPGSGSGGAISLQSLGQMTILGSLIAPAGKINATISEKTEGVAYDNTLSLFVGSNALLSATGHYAVTPTNNGLLKATVLDAGSIKLNGGRGAIVLQEGSVLDVSGASGQTDIAASSGYTRQTLYGAAGSIEVSARNAMVLDGDMQAAATGTGTDGSLTMAFIGSDDDGGNGHPNGARTLAVTQSKINRGVGLEAGDVLDSITGSGAISAQQITDAGFGTVKLDVDRSVNGDKVVLSSGLDMQVQDALTLKTSLLEVAGSGTATLAANYVALGGTTGGTPTAGTAALQVNAQWIDLSGSTAVSGVNMTSLSAKLDIRGIGSALTAPGAMVLSARQIYPVSNGAFSFETVGSGNSIEVKSSGVASTVPLSAAGQLTLKADSIIQGGVLRAPLGQITLDAANTLTLKHGSLTSISAEGQLIPYGLTSLGGLVFQKPSVDIDASTDGGTKELIAKKVEIKAAVVDTESGAKVDISGGSDTLAYEWIAGIGGSDDILGKTDVYAVLPTLQGEYAPFDYNYQLARTGSTGTPRTDIKAGDSIYLANVPGLASGSYTLLPARYALLPGAFMVQASSASLAAGQSATQLDGSTLVTGYRLNGISRDTLDSTFKVTSGSIFRPATGAISRAPSEYRLTTGNQFFTDLANNAGNSVPRLAADAGHLVINASSSLVLDASVLANKPQGARGALVDIVSDKISVVSTIGTDDGTLQLTAASLNGLNAESLLLGGVRTTAGNEYTITTNASSLVFANDADHALEVTELVAAASDTLSVEAGATIHTLASGQTAGTTNLHASGDGALLAVSALNDLVFDRSSVSNVKGSLNVASGAQVTAHRSLVLDSTAAASLDGVVSVVDGGSITLGSKRVVLGAPDASVTGLRVSDTLLTSFGNLAKATLNSYKNIDIYGPVNLGSSDLDLTLNAGGIAGHMSANEVATLTAKNLILKNSQGASYEAASAATGSELNLNASNITLAGGAATTNTVLGGFDKVNLNAAKEVSFSGAGTTTINASQTRFTSSRITAATAADYTFTATGTLTTAIAVSPATLAAATGLGGKLKMVGTEVTLGGNIELPSGQFTAQATTGNLTVAADGLLKAASVPVAFDKYTAYTPGGTITLQADAGNVTINTDAQVDVSGAGDADAGTLKISAVSGTATVDGTLSGAAGVDGGNGGGFISDTNTLTSFSTLNTRLNAGGFNASRDMRIRSGDVTIAASDTVTAQQFVLSADAGKVDIYGTVDASGSKGGSIEVYAKNNLTLKTGAQLLARGQADSTVQGDLKGSGGSVLLSSLSTASINAVSAETGALIDVSGDQQGVVAGNKGDVTLRGYRGTTGNTNTVNVAFGTTAAVKGAQEVRVEGVKVYTSTTFATTTPAIVSETNAFYTANTGLGSYEATQGGATIRVLPNIEVRSTSGTTLTDLAISADLNMRAFGVLQVGKGGTLTLRANKNLNINGSLSDGFSTATTAGLLQTGDTFSYQLVGGADFTAANTMATVKDAGNFSLANSKLIRTGTGDIRIAAGGNLTMGNDSSVIYTVGQAASSFSGFTAPTSGTTAASYLTNGGDIQINAMGNIVGQIAANGAQQLISPWLFRQGGGTGNKNTSWWVRPDLFKQGVATLGGGDMSVNAGGSITNFSVSAPTTARYASNGSVSLNGGGDVRVAAGGDIASGVYFAGKGNVILSSGGEIKSSASNTFGTTLALQDASAKVSAVKNAYIETVFNPTMWSQVTTNATTLETTGINSYFLTYGVNSAFRLDSLTGSATLGATNTSNITSHLAAGTNTTTLGAALEIHPATVEARAFSGDINVGRLVLSPSASGNLTLLAAGSVNSSAANSLIVMSDADASLLPSVSKPLSQSGGYGTTTFKQIRIGHAATPLHVDDAELLTIIARDGSINLPGNLASGGSSAGSGLTSPKAAYVHAGKDIKLSADIQHLNSDDMTVIEAGRDFIMPSDLASTVQLGGPGELLVQAGRNVSLGTSKGIVTVANTENTTLPKDGASITVLAGLGKEGADLTDYIAAYINPAGSGPSVLQGDGSKLAEYRQQTAQAVTDYMRKQSGDSNLSDADAMTQYLALDKNRQAVFAYRHFSSELLASGKGFAKSKNHNRGDTAIAMLFPTVRNYDGDLALYNSQLRTSRDGSIDILTPGGFINVGVPTSSGNDIGIVTEKGGAIRAFAETGFQVEQSRVITQYGSDITVWVNNGDIDAGRGSKSAVSVPERVVSTDVNGNTTIEVKGAATGSGIRAQSYDPDGLNGAQVAPRLGSVALIAPRGVLNASEAGIAAGDFLAVATQVIGADNIQVSGSSSGVPLADTSSLGGLAGVSNIGSDATKAGSEEIAKQVAQSASNPFAQMQLPSFISVDVIGLGDESTSQ